MAEIAGLYDPEAMPSSGFDLLADGDYLLQLIETDIVATGTDGDGNGLKYKAEVTEGEAKGRFIFGFINLANKNAQAQQIGQGEFAAMRKAVGVLAPEDTQDLHFKEFKAKIGTKPGNKDKKTGKEYGPQNVIKKFYFEGDDAAPAGKTEAKTVETKTVTPPAKRPWQTKK